MSIKLSNTNRSAFTLVEMLVVITIVGILTSLPMVAIQNSRENTRNAKRIADAKQMQNALELYYNDNNSYPSTLTPGETLSSNSITYIQQIPSAPTPNDGDCSEQENGFTYVTSRPQYDYFNVTDKGSTHSYSYDCSNDNNNYSINFCLSANTGSFSAGEVIASPRGLNSWTCGDPLLDYRDGESYDTVQIGSQCWMAENMRYNINNCSSTDWVNGSDVGWCGYRNTGSCEVKIGRLYQWSAAMNDETEERSQGVCPDGWHVPSLGEWIEATTTINNNINYRCNGIEGNISKAVSSIHGWAATTTSCLPGNNTSTNNTTGFNIFPSGYRGYNSGTYYSVTWGSYIWTSSFEWSETSQAYFPNYIKTYETWPYVYKGRNYHAYGYAVRCIKDSD